MILKLDASLRRHDNRIRIVQSYCHSCLADLGGAGIQCFFKKKFLAVQNFSLLKLEVNKRSFVRWEQ